MEISQIGFRRHSHNAGECTQAEELVWRALNSDIVAMEPVISYAADVGGNRRASWVLYGFLGVPSILTTFFCMAFRALAEFIVVRFEHPATVEAGWLLQWQWEDRCCDAAFWSAILSVTTAMSLMVAFFFPRVDRWLRTRAPLWILAVPLNLSMLVMFAVATPQSRG